MINEDICNIIKFGSWLWDLIVEIMDCNCKNSN
jgi:hypothetical protein